MPRLIPGASVMASAMILGAADGAWAQVPANDTPIVLPPIQVTAPYASPLVYPSGISPDVSRFSLPQTIESVDKRQVEDTTNAVDTEDAIKYLPSILVRKRNYGDTQPTVETRTWGINSSARNLVYVDDIPISALISNNNSTGAPRWGLVSPEEITGIDMLYGPFAAAYPGNSMGGVLRITTEMPESFQATAKQSGALQTFNWYKTQGTYGTSNSAVTVGDKLGKLSYFLSLNHEDSTSQPLFFITNGSLPAGTTGGITAQSKTGTTADVVGAGGLLHSVMNNVTGKFALDVTDWLKASYLVGYWENDTKSTVQSYLTSTTTGAPTYGGVAGFASNNYTLNEQHLMNGLSLKTDTGRDWDWELVATRYDYLNDKQLNPAGVSTGTSFTTNGTVTRLDGTGWMTQDAKAIWRPTGKDGGHEVSFGLHGDQYVLNNPVLKSNDWNATPNSGNGNASTISTGKTQTYAAWAQDAWKFAPNWKLTFGGRLETWRASDGYNLAGSTAVNQPVITATNFSPKATLGWQVDRDWSAKLSFGQAYRYPTVAELYQIVATGPVFSVPNPNLKPENVYSGEIAIERRVEDSRVRLSLFQETTKNALISQTSLISGTFTTTFQNVSETRNRGAELVLERDNIFVPGLSITNSTTFVDSRIVSDPSWQSSTGTTATGKRVPYVPEWRNTTVVTYRPDERTAFTVAARYQSKIYSTLDNTDTVAHVFGGFDKFFVVDTHARYQITDIFSAEAGIDNLFNDKYFLFHPFPTRTYVASVKAKF